MYELFIQACEKCGVPLSDTQINGQLFKKPARAWYHKVGEEVLDYIRDDPSYENIPLDYSGYLREYFKRLRSALENRHVKEVGYREADMQPFLAFMRQVIGHKPSVKLKEKILYAQNIYSYFNFWRTPHCGSLTKTKEHIIFEGDKLRAVFPCSSQAKVIKMPPVKGSWVRVFDERKSGYLALSDGVGKVLTPAPLLSFLELKDG